MNTTSDSASASDGSGVILRVWLAVCRDRVEFNLALRDSSDQGHVGKVYIQMSGVDQYYAQITKAGATVAVPLADRVYGMTDCRVLDPDANELSFGEATAP